MYKVKRHRGGIGRRPKLEWLRSALTFELRQLEKPCCKKCVRDNTRNRLKSDTVVNAGSNPAGAKTSTGVVSQLNARITDSTKNNERPRRRNALGIEVSGLENLKACR